ncbi:MAG: ABC transporter ATP-binding protein [Thermoplasmatota archaeon]
MPNAIETTRLTKRYGSFVAVKAVDLRVQQGEVFGFLGPNGAGKSTTTKMLATLLRPTEGEARVAGFDVRTEALEVRRAIGYLPERMPVYRTMTAREYLDTFARIHGIPKKERHERAERLLTLVNLQGVEGKAVGTFSKGMTQRLGLARALVNDPKVLFLDEPASGLDPTGRKEIRTLMRSLTAAGTTIFLCTHDLAEAQAVCDRIGFIRDGQLVQTQRVGEVSVGTRRILIVELEGFTPAVKAAVVAVSGVSGATFESPRLSIEFAEPASRQELARVIQKAGGVILGVEEKVPNLEALYERYVERPRTGEAVQELAAESGLMGDPGSEAATKSSKSRSDRGGAP